LPRPENFPGYLGTIIKNRLGFDNYFPIYQTVELNTSGDTFGGIFGII